MRFRYLLALLGLAAANPLPAATIILHPEETDHHAGFNLNLFLGTGVYAARFAFDRPVQPGSLLTFIHNASYDFYGMADGVHYGGDDVPAYWDHALFGRNFSTLLRVERPYRLLQNWGGDIGDVEERGLYYLDAAYGDLYFPTAAPVRMDYGFVRVGEVPEPSSWAMLITGFAVIGAALRLKRRAVGESEPFHPA